VIQKLDELLREIAMAKTGTLVLYGWDGDSVIRAELWEYFLKDGAHFSFFYEPLMCLSIHVLGRTDTLTYSEETLANFTIFKLRHCLHRWASFDWASPATVEGLQLLVADTMVVMTDDKRLSDYLKTGSRKLSVLAINNEASTDKKGSGDVGGLDALNTATNNACGHPHCGLGGFANCYLDRHPHLPNVGQDDSVLSNAAATGPTAATTNAENPETPALRGPTAGATSNNGVPAASQSAAPAMRDASVQCDLGEEGTSEEEGIHTPDSSSVDTF